MTATSRWVLVVLGALLAAPRADAQTSRVDTRPAPVVTPTRIEGQNPRTMPPLTGAERESILETIRNRPKGPNPSRRRAPTDPNARPELVVPMSPEMPLPANAGGRAPGDFTFFATHQYTDAETGDLTSTFACEPSVSTNGRVSWITGNWFSGPSGDYLANSTFVNPANNFPGPDVFCCDQVLQYDRTRGAMFWYLQYQADATGSNIVRLAVSVGQSDQENNNWFIYDFDPQQFGYPAGVQFDFPDMALGANNLYVTTNILGGADAAICLRLNLDQLASGSAVTLINFVSPLPNLRTTQGAGTTAWIGTQVDTNTLRIFEWPEGGALTQIDRDVAAWATGSTAPDPNGVDWVAFDPNDILGSYVSGSSMFFLWDAAASGSFPMPHIRIAQFRQSDRALIGEGAIWSPTNAWAYPAVHPNDRGDVGGVFTVGGGGLFPTMVAVVADGFGGSQLGPYQGFTVVGGSASPGMGRWGDYQTARRANPYGNTWVVAGWVRDATEPGSLTEPWSAWFGREQDSPPLQKFIRVDLANTATWEEGTVAHPYDTVFEGAYATMPGDVVEIQAGSYDETTVLDRACTVRAINGTVFVGQ